MAVCDGKDARASGNSDSAVDDASNPSKSATSALHVSSRMHVFLQTAQVVLSKPELEGTKKLNIRAIFNTGAQRSYVSKSGGCIETGNHQHLETRHCYIWKAQTRSASG